MTQTITDSYPLFSHQAAAVESKEISSRLKSTQCAAALKPVYMTHCVMS